MSIGLRVNVPMVKLPTKPAVSVAARAQVKLPTIPSVKLPVRASVDVKVKSPIENVGDIKISARTPKLPTPDVGIAGIMDVKVDLGTFHSSTVSNLSSKVSAFSPGRSIFRVATTILTTKKNLVSRAKEVTDSVSVKATVKL